MSAASVIISALLPLTAASLAAHSLFAAGSLAYYRHDWGWPATATQFFLSLWRDAGAWDSSGLGEPNHQPVLHPVLLLWHLAAPLLQPWLVGALTIFVCATAFAYGVSACCRHVFQLPAVPSAMLGCAALLGPPFYNKIVAGHIYYVIALAAYPWVVRFSIASDVKPRSGALAVASVGALCALQVQIFIASLIAIVAGCLRGRRYVVSSLLAAAASFVLLLPEALAYANADVVHNVASMQTTLAWQYNNSAPFFSALISVGYAPHYYAHALATVKAAWIVQSALWVLVLSAVLGTIMLRRDRMAWVLLALWVAMAFLVAGLYGPFAAILSYLYTHALWASAFRELYHFAGIEWTLLCVLAAVACRRLSARVTYPLLGCAVAILALPWSAANFAGQLVAAPPSSYALSALRSISASHDDTRFLLVPSEWPLRPNGSQSSGEDPLAYATASSPTANVYRLDGTLEAAAHLTEASNPAAARWRAIAGIGTVLSRSGVAEDLSARFPPIANVPPYVRSLMARRTAFSNAMTRSSTCVLCAYGSIPTLREPTDSAVGDAFVLVRDTGAVHGGDPDLARASAYRIPNPSTQTIDPSVGWVSATMWSWLDVRIALNSEGVITWSKSRLQCPSAKKGITFVHVLLMHGTLTTDRGRLRVPAGKPIWVSLPHGARTLKVTNGLAVVNRFVTLPYYAPESVSSGAAPSGERALSYDWISEKGTGVIGPAVHFIVLKQSYSSNWRLAMKHGRVVRHFVASGYANGWQVDTNKSTEVSVYYNRTQWNRTLLALSLLVWIGITLTAVLKR
jgi:hypothetical protein